MKTNKLLLSLLLTGALCAVTAQAATLLGQFNGLDGTADLSRDTTNDVANNISTSGSSASLLIDTTGNTIAPNDSRGYRVNTMTDSSFSDPIRYFGFVLETAPGYVFDLSDSFTTGDGFTDYSYAQVVTDRISGGNYNVEAVIWEGNDRTGTELFRDTWFASDTTSDATMRFDGITNIAGVPTNISQIYVQFNYRGVSNAGIAFDNIRLVGDVVAIPEPSSIALMGLALVGVIIGIRRRK